VNRPDLTQPNELPHTWFNALALFHRLWGQARERTYVAADWQAFHRMLDTLTPFGSLPILRGLELAIRGAHYNKAHWSEAHKLLLQRAR